MLKLYIREVYIRIMTKFDTLLEKILFAIVAFLAIVAYLIFWVPLKVLYRLLEPVRRKNAKNESEQSNWGRR